MLTIIKRRTKIGPDDHGRKMSLKDFEFVETEEGCLFELSRGYISVSEIENLDHALVVAAVRGQLILRKVADPKAYFVALGNIDCKLVIPTRESERHPDIAVYFARPNGATDDTVWRHWIPQLTIEVVSERTTDRDYIDKREDYWALGIKEYWIVDSFRAQVVVLRRGKADWIEKRVGPGGIVTTKLLPGFELPFKVIQDAAAKAGMDEE